MSILVLVAATLALSWGCNGRAQDAAGLDPVLTGTMVLEGPDETGSYLLDLDTGLTRPLVGTTRSQTGRSVRWGETVPSPRGDRFHAVIDGCARDNARSLSTDCVVTLDQDGNETDRFETGRVVYGGVHESPDGALLAFVVYNASFDTRTLMITDRRGRIQSEGEYAGGRSVRGDVTAVRWLPDGDLVYSTIREDRLVRVTGAPAARPEDDTPILDGPRTSLPRDGALGLGHFDVDPASGRIAFIWNAGRNATDERDDTLYLLSPRTGTFEPLARVGPVPRLASPQWSPDGAWIALNAGSRTDGFRGYDTRDTALIAIRVGGSSGVVQIDGNDRSSSADVVFVSSDCVRGGTCGAGSIGATESRKTSGWFVRR